MNAAIQTKHYTSEEYLDREEQAEFRSEYRNGAIVAMTGGTANHNQIAINLVTLLRVALKGQDYRIYMNDMRLVIPTHCQYTYPDVILIAGKPVFETDRKTTVLNPCAIAEVLSASTQNHDKGEKFDYYRSIPELKEYLLFDQYSSHVMQYKKTEAGWLLAEYFSTDNQIDLFSVPLSFGLSDIYDLVEFE